MQLDHNLYAILCNKDIFPPDWLLLVYIQIVYTVNNIVYRKQLSN